MDGTQIATQELLRKSFCYAGALAVVALTHALNAHAVVAQTPLMIQTEQRPQPIHGRSRWAARNSLPSTQPTLVRPTPRVLIADRGSNSTAVTEVERQPSDPNSLTPGTDGDRLPGSADHSKSPRLSSPSPFALSPTATQGIAGKPGSVVERLGIDEALDRRGSVTFRKTPLSEVVFLLSELWHVNIVAGESVTGDVSGAFHDAPLREVLSAALTANGYSYRKTGTSLIVLPIDQVGADDPNFTSELIRMPQGIGDVDTTFEAVELLLSERGQMRRVGTDSVLVVDTADRVSRVRRLFSELTSTAAVPPSVAQTAPADRGAGESASPVIPATVVQSGIAYFTPQFTTAEEMGEPLREALGQSVVVAVYPEENRIMVKGTSDDLRIASQAIEQLDRPRPQVRITAMIYDVALSEVERLGVNWLVRPHSSGTALADLNDSESLRFRNLFSAATDFISDPTTPGTASLAASSINNTINVDAFIQALDQSSEAKLLADPTITVRDRTQASIRIVQKIPIVAANPVENSAVVFSQVEFEEAGVILNVLPQISRDGTIDLKVNPEYSVVVNFIENNPVIDSRTAETTVRVANGQMFVLGGLRQKTIVESIRGLPYLKDVKYVGKLFRAHETEVRESELIVFLKPELVTPCHHGTLREQQAAVVSTEELRAIPFAERMPLTPYCQDCNCPNHAPRPRINGGSRDLEMLGGNGISITPVYEEVLSDAVVPYGHVTPQVIEPRVIVPRAIEPRAIVPDAISHGAVTPRLDEPQVIESPVTESAPVGPAEGDERGGVIEGIPDTAKDADPDFPPVHVDRRFKLSAENE